jgi:hypothetical protein
VTARSGWPISGVDFTSRPRKQKPIAIATGTMRVGTFELKGIEAYCDWETYECWLKRDGPWVAGFDFPFGLPREAIRDLGWPATWRELVLHCRLQGRESFRMALDRYRESRPTGNRYAHRATDHPAGSHSPPAGESAGRTDVLRGCATPAGSRRHDTGPVPGRSAEDRVRGLSRICDAADGERLVQK